jgi:hypothetical protein
MGNEMTDEVEALLIIDESGDYFAIPREVVESHRLSTEERASVDEELGEDVEGFRQSAAGAKGAASTAHQAKAAGAGAANSLGIGAIFIKLPPRFPKPPLV